jgi:hypothetical protein
VRVGREDDLVAACLPLPLSLVALGGPLVGALSFASEAFLFDAFFFPFVGGGWTLSDSPVGQREKEDQPINKRTLTFIIAIVRSLFHLAYGCR